MMLLDPSVFDICFQNCAFLVYFAQDDYTRCRGVAKIRKVNKSQNDVIGRPLGIFIRDLFIELKGQKLQESRVDAIKMILFLQTSLWTGKILTLKFFCGCSWFFRKLISNLLHKKNMKKSHFWV